MYDYHLDWKYAAAPDKRPRPQPCGYLVGLQADSTTLSPDLTTPATFTGTPQYPGIGKAYDPANQQMHVCGLIEGLRWDGGLESPMQVSFFVSDTSQMMLQSELLRGRPITILDFKFWIVGYEYPAQSGKPGVWYEVAYPIGPTGRGAPGSVHGPITSTGATLDFEVSDIPTPIEPTGVKMFACTMRMAPEPNQSFTLFQATSPTNKQVLPWGIHVG
ncbi:hypothetical protein ACFXHA_01835 [Nocardia sp. NPDC059240]|uniref:hypothetical protein n=1 Tax=Nocardia sp. NPDC059240 TaxID=3346786 RepID=UPI0036CB77B6